MDTTQRLRPGHPGTAASIGDGEWEMHPWVYWEFRGHLTCLPFLLLHCQSSGFFTKIREPEKVDFSFSDLTSFQILFEKARTLKWGGWSPRPSVKLYRKLGK
jgi:hypothetical protein